MSDRRSGPPLFDLMRERGEDPNAPKPTQSSSVPAPTNGGNPPTPRPMPSSSGASGIGAQGSGQTLNDGPDVPARQTAWDSSGGVSRAERSAAAAMLDEQTTQDTGIRIPMSRVYLIVVVVLAFLIGAWVIGYQLGFKEGKSQIEQYTRDQPVVRPAPVTSNDPPIDTNPSNPGLINNGSSSNSGTDTPVFVPTQIGHIIHSSGALASDPRQIGLNYLILAELGPEQTADAIQFMDQHGVEIIGVPTLDSQGSRANNPSRYTLYSLGLAIPGNRWSSMSVERNQHQTLISNLGVRWQRERRGGSDFTSAYWQKYEP